ncbi:MAG: DNA repair protein RecO [Nitrospirota bacterium]
MKKTLTDKFIILGHKNFFEKDKLVFLYSDEHGKLTAIAKGARSITSKFTGHLETLNFCIANLYFGPKNIILTDIYTDKSHFKNRKCLSTISHAIRIAEISNKIIYENQQIENLESLISETLKNLKSSGKKSLIFTAYIIKILDKLGVIPDFRETKVSLEEKYVKFINFIKEKPFSEIEKISPTKAEKERIQQIITLLIEKEIGPTPSLFSF